MIKFLKFLMFVLAGAMFTPLVLWILGIANLGFDRIFAGVWVGVVASVIFAGLLSREEGL